MEFKDVREGHTKIERVWEIRRGIGSRHGLGLLWDAENRNQRHGNGTEQPSTWESLGERKQVGVKKHRGHPGRQ